MLKVQGDIGFLVVLRKSRIIFSLSLEGRYARTALVLALRPQSQYWKLVLYDVTLVDILHRHANSDLTTL